MPETDPAADAAAPMTPEAIRQLDGSGLTRLAASLGLMPDGLQLEERSWRDRHRGYLWEPHENLAQADEVFRSLRARGYVTSNYSGRDFGRIYAKQSAMQHRGADRFPGIEILWGIGEPGNPAVETEAHALLLCTVLTINRERGA